MVRRNNWTVVFVSQWFHFFNYFHEWKEAGMMKITQSITK